MTTHPSWLVSMLVALAACATKTASDTRDVASPAAQAPPQEAAAPVSAAPAPASGSTASTPVRPGCAQSFAAFDADADGRVSREEFLAPPHALPAPESVFAARDGDSDGALTSTEFCAGWGAGCGSCMSMGGAGPGVSGPGAGVTRGPGMGMGPGRAAMAQGGGPRCHEHFRRFDANGDGSVTEPEFGAFPHPHADAHEMFVARDQNHDGRLTQAELCVSGSTPSPSPATP